MSVHDELTMPADLAEDTYVGDELPEQGGSPIPTIFPGTSVFLLPTDLESCWSSFDVPRKDQDGNAILAADGSPVVDHHLMLKFDRDRPLLVVGGENDGLPALTTLSTLGRKRGKKPKGEDTRKAVSDLAYFLKEALLDQTVILRRADWMGAINKHGGHMVRAEHGLSGYCDPERVRYIPDGEGGAIEDPDGVVGCSQSAGPGKMKSRLYSDAFKTKVWSEEQQKEILAWTDRVQCKNCHALLRGFFRIERWLRPLGSQ